MAALGSQSRFQRKRATSAIYFVGQPAESNEESLMGGVLPGSHRDATTGNYTSTNTCTTTRQKPAPY
eukprot:scaffold499350_cov13-Prasinocladus_malaysianus.AAC.1